jgi:hypothetical protein
MTVRLSTGVRNGLAGNYGFAEMFNRGSINIYSGTQPATADSAVTGTLLGTVTLSSGALTQETQATGSITITGGTTSILTVTVGGFNIIPDSAVAYNTSTTQTASDLCDAINRNGIYTATVSGAVVTIKPPQGAGASHNGYVVTSTGSVTATYVAMAGGVSPVNGLTFGVPSSGVVSKAGVWSFNGIAAGTAGWFRLIGSTSDAGALVSAAPWPFRVDGSIAVSGADLNLSNVVIAVASPNTIDSFSLTIPAQ